MSENSNTTENENRSVSESSGQLAAKPETWDAVAETYHIELEDGDRELAGNIEKILKRNGLKKGDSLIEMGCGSGHLSACLAQEGYQVTLVDFSPVALSKAKQTFEKYGLKGNFILGDLFNLDESIPVCDFAWNSGVMEHFGDAELEILLKSISKYSRNGVLYLVPNSSSIAYLLMRARLMSQDQWLYGEEFLRQDYEIMLKNTGYRHVAKFYVSTAAISAYQIWKAEKEQGNLSELYRRLTEENMLPREEGYLVAYFASEKELPENVPDYSGATLQNTRMFDLVAKKIGYENQKAEIEQLKKQIQVWEDSAIQFQEKRLKYENKLHKLEVLCTKDADRIQELELSEKQKEEKIYELEVLRNRAWDEYQQKMISRDNDVLLSANIRKEISDVIGDILKSRIYRFAYLLHRWSRQNIHGSREEKRIFRKWFRDRIRRHPTPVESFYNPFRRIQAILDGGNHIQDGICRMDDRSLSDFQMAELNSCYQKTDILIFSVIDFDFRYQRPQHFAERFARNGHRVFYINANLWCPDKVVVKSENLYVVNLHYDKESNIYSTDFSNDSVAMEQLLDGLLYSFCIRDALVIVDYPNWVHAAIYLRQKWGFKFITDYMDDFTGFLDTTGKLLCHNCKMLLSGSDLVIASSQFLYDIARKYNDCCALVRNGTEFEHFHASAFREENSGKRVIGYYGAVAHWFDYQKVCYLADRFRECEVLIVGDVTEWKDELESHTNIVLLGEKKYSELPEYLKRFDVCLIPFDTSTDLIKATNPVKFYEYLSAGKKIVATEIPELMPYRDRFVYMSNDNEIFGDYVEKCLKNEDTLASFEERISFGKENDWQKRYEMFYDFALSAVPKVSIITITYNNLTCNKAFLDTLLNKTAYANYEIILVDNLSTDGTREWLKEVEKQKDPRIHIVLNDQNLGFAGGNNCGLHLAQGDYVLLLNNDTLVTRGWLTSLVKHLENHDPIGMVGAVTNSIGNEAMIPASYEDICGLHQFSYLHTSKHLGERYDHASMLAMFCTLIRRDVIDKCGGLDERYGLGMFEDDDYCETVKRAGYRIAIAEDAYIHHFQSLSFSKLKHEELWGNFYKNQKLFEEKWKKEWKMPSYRSGITPETNKEVKIRLG